MNLIEQLNAGNIKLVLDQILGFSLDQDLLNHAKALRSRHLLAKSKLEKGKIDRNKCSLVRKSKRLSTIHSSTKYGLSFTEIKRIIACIYSDVYLLDLNLE